MVQSSLVFISYPHVGMLQLRLRSTRFDHPNICRSVFHPRGWCHFGWIPPQKTRRMQMRRTHFVPSKSSIQIRYEGNHPSWFALIFSEPSYIILWMAEAQKIIGAVEASNRSSFQVSRARWKLHHFALPCLAAAIRNVSTWETPNLLPRGHSYYYHRLTADTWRTSRDLIMRTFEAN